MVSVDCNGDTPKKDDQEQQGNREPLGNVQDFDLTDLDLTNLDLTDCFESRHIGLNSDDWQIMVEAVGCATVADLIAKTVPEKIRFPRLLNLPSARSEFQALQDLKAIAGENQVFRSYIGMGYYGCITPPVIQRNILENPGWYTQYTPYQAEIAQGRLEALLNFQTMVMDLTGMEIANASLLDEGTAAAEAMTMVYGIVTSDKKRQKEPPQKFFISTACHPQTIAVVQTRAIPLGIEVVLGDHTDPVILAQLSSDYFGALLQYPATDGAVYDDNEFITKLHGIGGLVVVATDLLALTLLKPPAEFGADVVVGSAQRFGVPLGYGGPHAAFLATREAYKRQIPGRVVGISKDIHGQPALRLALQTREQHIRRDKATSNICTAQVLLAVMASMYAVYHGATGLKRIAQRVHRLTNIVATGLRNWGYTVVHGTFFDTLKVILPIADRQKLLEKASAAQVNLRIYPVGSADLNGNDGTLSAVGISLDESVTAKDLQQLCQIFAPDSTTITEVKQLIQDLANQIPQDLAMPAFCQRQTEFLTHPVFQVYHSETELLRYINRLQAKDLSLTTSMIPLGSCTMKLNATAEMLPVTWAEFGQIHPFAPQEQTKGYQILFQQLETWLGEITGFAGVSLQPNAGSQGEYAGLLTIRNYHHARGETQRHVCLIPTSAHGTNPASAVMAGMTVVPVV
ncbi:MAG: aminomethyl-transferring glycine dehydrogenase, partial [Pseudanabaenaceae cyanobacterium]